MFTPIYGILSKPKIALRRLQLRFLAARTPRRVVVGAGTLRQDGWVNTDQTDLDILQEDDWRVYFRPDSVSAILAEHVWEHLELTDGLRAAQLCYQFLRPGGYLRIAVPDGWSPDDAYIAAVRPGGTGSGADDHHVLYNVHSLTEMLAEAGFSWIEGLEFFDRSGKFHAVDWRPEDGFIARSCRFDERNQGGKLRYTSLIVDARK